MMKILRNKNKMSLKTSSIKSNYYIKVHKVNQILYDLISVLFTSAFLMVLVVPLLY